MNEQNATENHENLPLTEAGTSISFKMLDPNGVDLMITVREPYGAPNADLNAITRAYGIIKRAVEKGWTAGGKAGNTNNPPSSSQTPSISQPGGGTAPKQPQPASKTAPSATTGTVSQNTTQSGDLTFVATTLTVEFNPRGERVGKLKGGQFMKHGIRLWPEAATEIFGYDLAATDPGDYPIEPTKVRYCLNDQQKPQKIVGRAA